MLYFIVLVAFFILMLLYFKIAERYNIVDRPNERSSHTVVTIRGGGIIFCAASLLILLLYPAYWLPATGSLMIGAISFIDDRITLSNKIRLIVHFASVTAMFLFLNIFHLSWYWPVIFYILAIGIINVYNFMDGINGITGVYTLVTLGALQYINLRVIPFTEANMIWFLMLASIVFLYFNFRTRARCFAGDVGSITIAFWLVFFLIKIILQTNDWKYILLLSVYGVDSVLTIIHRLILKQNIFKAHRLHFYQLMANERKVPHLVVSAIYGIVQGIINLFLVNQIGNVNSAITFVVVLLPLVVIYIIVKRLMMGKRDALSAA
ncbi:UDP-GlcNAc--UDP-phosphate GlcNAc-1-phosphate transferase [Mucilaginibacter sp. MD40]|uniref:MraY family glycosyltransferase n=1 Tax=Mucilaginibacter sp. MD40 TaxID=2029590 RepID=UPI000BAC8849|nr:glycosyltransferase family 4 protein [Mucilaginibacter sp. MD40]PAW93411.1 UDP-GlcNAc--UDP-phosphate GlcNAc-1-phosphate transferase [Mucilaginibacter sp. MD40]